MLSRKTGMIILINGTSSSGKSAMLNKFKKLCGDFVIFKIDDWLPDEYLRKAKALGWHEDSGLDPWSFLHDYMVKKTGKYYFDTELRKELFDNFCSFYESAKQAALQGQNIVIDTVVEYEKEHKLVNSVFPEELKVVKVLVYCPLDTLLERVAQRNKLGKPEEMRPAFLSFEQFPAIYKIQEHKNEIVIDTIQSKVMKNALESAIQELIENNIPQPYLPKLDKFKRSFTQNFKLDEQEEIKLVPKHHYDLILNSKVNSAHQLAQNVVNYMKTRF